MTHRYFSGRIITVSAALLTLTACHHTTIEERAEQEAKNFTEKYCPTPEKDFQRTDSIVFNRDTHTFTYYYLLTGAADDAETVKKIKTKLHTALVNDLKGNTSSKIYKEQGFSFHYVFRSKKTKETLYEETLTKKDYQ